MTYGRSAPRQSKRWPSVIVADANLLAYLVMPGQRTDEAEAVLSKIR